MRSRYIMPIILCLTVGFFIGQFLLNQYHNKEKIKPAFSEKEKVFFIQQGVYSTKESMEKNTLNFSHYIYHLKEDKYYVFIGITKNNKNAEKLKNHFKNIGYDTIIKEFEVDNESFLEVLGQYDLLLENTNDNDAIKTICNQVLAKYEELVTSNESQD
ncbi:MAG: hypothetical protein GX247_03725 [Mollicutes bacterium]|nr:hypothetical protein [Mollicutes bacterium]